MKHEVNLDIYTLYTDLAVETIAYNNIKIDEKKYRRRGIFVSNIYIDNKVSKKIGKKSGNYTTLSFKDITDSNNRKNIERVLINELSRYIKG